jgi:hypothetical protein
VQDSVFIQGITKEEQFKIKNVHFLDVFLEFGNSPENSGSGSCLSFSIELLKFVCCYLFWASCGN